MKQIKQGNIIEVLNTYLLDEEIGIKEGDSFTVTRVGNYTVDVKCEESDDGLWTFYREDVELV